MSVRRYKLAAFGCAAMFAAAQYCAAQTVPTSSPNESKQLGSPGSSIRPRGATTTAPVEKPRSGWISSTILPLAGVLGLAIVGGRLIRTAARRSGSLRSALGAGGRSPSGIMEILGRYPISRGATLVLLKVDSRVLLLSQSGGGRFGAGAGFATLAEITDPEEVASILIKSRDAEGDSLAERFRTMMSRFDRQMDGKAAESAWEGVGARSDIPVIDLTKRQTRRGSPSRMRLSPAKAESGGRS